MFDDERYLLALGVLEGEAHTHQILADFLEEQGQRGLAQWARRRKAKRDKCLNLVLVLLPPAAVLRIATDLVQHVADRRVRLPVGSELLAGVIQAFRNYDTGGDPDMLKFGWQRLLGALGSVDLQWQPRHFADTFQHFGMVAQETWLAASRADANQVHHAMQAGIHAGKLADGLRRMLVNTREAGPDELSWQIRRTRDELNALTGLDAG